jgi:hypothetical protein
MALKISANSTTVSHVKTIGAAITGLCATSMDFVKTRWVANARLISIAWQVLCAMLNRDNVAATRPMHSTTVQYVSRMMLVPNQALSAQKV